jgi:Cellulase (glycosyl hydrolase family 5)
MAREGGVASSRARGTVVRRRLLFIAAAALLFFGRASGWPGPEDSDPGFSDNTDSLTYTDSLGQTSGSSSAPTLLAPGQGGAGSHYFVNASNQPVPLVGVSADNACHFNVTGSGQCNYSNYQQKILDDANDGLNVIRLWVNVGGLPASGCAANTAASDPNDQPFTYSATNLQSDGLGRWYLDVQNAGYFQRLYNVVNYAAANNMYVEVTIFSPFTGTLYLGPWSTAHAYLQNGTHLAGFSDGANFVNTGSAQYQAMKSYVFKVVDWTVDSLHSFPNLYYEVANEPEWVRPNQPAACTGWSTTSTTAPVTVASWQAAIAGELKSHDATYGANHLVAVEPLTTTDANQFTGSGPYVASAGVVNSHYTNIAPRTVTGLSTIGLGAIHLVRGYNSQPKILGFNETKITSGSSCVTANTSQTVDEGRAEAWEFMVDQGGIYNQFGYSCNSTDYYETRRQMGVLRSFLSGVVNIGRNMKTSSSSPSWVNPGPWRALEPSGSHKFWAAVEPTSTALTKRWLLYIHHSSDRGLVYDGYQEYYTSPPQYQEHVGVCLGTTSGNYTAKWIAPTNAVLNGVVQTLQSTPISWTGTSACTPGGGGSAALASPLYSYDIALLIS